MIRVAVLCNDRLALPALNQLIPSGLLSGVGMTDAPGEIRSLVAQQCAAANIPVRLFARKGLAEGLKEWVDELRPDVVLVKTFPFRIPEEVLALPKHGFINFHYAPLPRWRGSNPLFWMIRDRASAGGVTVHRMDRNLDTGPILLEQSVPLNRDASFGMFCSELAFAGANLTGPLLQGLLAGNLKEKAQQDADAGWYGRPRPEDLFIDWKTMSILSVRALVNACNPWNKAAATRCGSWVFGIADSSPSAVPVPEGTAGGTVIALDEKNGFVIACADGTALRADVVYCEEGYYGGHKIAAFGVTKGMRLE